MKHFECMVPDCGWTVQSETEEQILEHVGEHARDVHGMHEVPPEIKEKVRSRIVDQ